MSDIPDEAGLFDVETPEPPPMPKTQRADQAWRKDSDGPNGSTAWEDREDSTWIDQL